MTEDRGPRRDCYTCFYGVSYASDRPRGVLYGCGLGNGFHWIRGDEKQYMDCYVEWGRAVEERKEAERLTGKKCEEPRVVVERMAGARRGGGKGGKEGWMESRMIGMEGMKVRVEGKFVDGAEWMVEQIENRREWWKGVATTLDVVEQGRRVREGEGEEGRAGKAGVEMGKRVRGGERTGKARE